MTLDLDNLEERLSADILKQGRSSYVGLRLRPTHMKDRLAVIHTQIHEAYHEFSGSFSPHQAFMSVNFNVDN